MWDLSSPPGIELTSPALQGGFPGPWTTREVLASNFLFDKFTVGSLHIGQNIQHVLRLPQGDEHAETVWWVKADSWQPFPSAWVPAATAACSDQWNAAGWRSAIWASASRGLVTSAPALNEHHQLWTSQNWSPWGWEPRWREWPLGKDPGFSAVTAIPAEVPDEEWGLQVHVPKGRKNHWAEPRLNCQTKESEQSFQFTKFWGGYLLSH